MNTIDATPQISHGDRATLGCPRYPFVKELLRTNTQNSAREVILEESVPRSHKAVHVAIAFMCEVIGHRALRTSFRALSGRSIGARSDSSRGHQAISARARR